MPSARMIGVGAFVIGGILLFAIALFMIGERQMMFTKQFEIYTQFSRLSGLQEGAPVQVSGMAAGEVKEIIVPKTPAGKFRLRLQLREDLHPLVRKDSIASIRTEGLVGGQFVMVAAGSESAAQAPNGGTIPSREPFDIADLLDQASQTVKNVNETIASLRGEIEGVITQVTLTVHDVDALVKDVGGDVREIATAGAKIADNIQTITAGVREGRGTVGQLFVNDDLYQNIDRISVDAQKTAANVRDASESAKRLLNDWGKKGGAAEGLTTEFRDTLTKARDTLTNLAENTEALKHNWFFSGYFKRRGYYSLADISPEDYRAGALEQAGRQRLRIWLQAGLILAKQPDGTLALTDDGKARLDSAMGDFLQYVGNSPLIVEGYAQEGAAAQRYLESQRRSSVVRDYLVGKYSLSPDRVGIMPLGAESPGSPTGNRFDGVALAVFVEAKKK